MLRRVRLLTSALLEGAFGGRRGERLPVAPLVFLAVLSALVAGLVRGELTPFGTALVTLSVALALGTLPLLGELAPMLRADPAREWVGGLPVRPREIRAARTLALAAVTAAIAAAVAVPGALIATDLGAAARAGLVAAAVLQAWAVAAALLWVQWVLGERGEGWLTLLQATLLVAVLAGLLAGLRRLPEIAELEGPSGAWLALPSAWFAAPFASELDASGARVSARFGGAAWGAVAAVALALATLAFAPFPPASRARSTRSALGFLLTPVRKVAERAWVRRDERASFTFVHDALPAERDFAIRTWPLVAMPLAFLFLGADPSTTEGEGLWALLLFAPVAYLPFVLMHVPVTATPAARWLIDCAPLERASEAGGARKAIAVRVLFPLHVGLGALSAVFVGPRFAATLAPVAAAFGLLALRLLHRRVDPPLSKAPGELAGAFTEGLASSVLSVGIAGSLIGLAAWRAVPGPVAGWSVLALAIGFEWLTRGGSSKVSGRNAGRPGER